MVTNNGIKASTPLDETHPQNMTATCFLSSQHVKITVSRISVHDCMYIFEGFKQRKNNNEYKHSNEYKHNRIFWMNSFYCHQLVNVRWSWYLYDDG